MQNNIILFPEADRKVQSAPKRYLTAADCDAAEEQFGELLELADLDLSLAAKPSLASYFEQMLSSAITAAFERESSSNLAHRFLQRVLYRINRLKLFWYDDLRRYNNERSAYLRGVRDQIEEAWQRWELAQLDIEFLPEEEVRQALIDRVAVDLAPAPLANSLYFRDEMRLAGYRRFLEIFSLDALVEASQLSRTLGGVGNEVHSVLTQLLLEEYGGGYLARKHSSYFAMMLEALNMETEPEAYFDSVPWEVLATINHSFLLSERKRYFLRYIGGLLYTEVSAPAAFRYYQAAAERLGLPSTAMSYWTVHIKEDKRRGQWILNDVALPLVAKYPIDAWELVLGYDQQRMMSSRAAAAIARSVREADEAASQSFRTNQWAQKR